MKQNSQSKTNIQTQKRKVTTIKPRVNQRVFKNEELFISKIKKDYEKFK